MATLTSCNTASLAPYVPSTAVPWNIDRVRHVSRRLGYGKTAAIENIWLTMSPTALVEQVITDAENVAPYPTPTWGNWTGADYTDFITERNDQIRELWVGASEELLSTGLKGKLTMFWLNHFVVQYASFVAPTYMWKFYKMVQENALGNFKDFVRAVGTEEAMLRYLNGAQNRKQAPNENYARELYELFTLGEDIGYTQTDITETARALTGYNSFTQPYPGTVIFNQYNTWDDQPKTIFGQTGNWDYDDVIDILFAQRAPQIAMFITEKLYRFFVSPELPNFQIIAVLAAQFETNWDIAALLRTMLKSEHFFDQNAIGCQIKSPFDLSHQFINEMAIAPDIVPDFSLIVLYHNANLGQDLFDPIDVAGWQGDYEWINSGILPYRFQYQEYIMWSIWNWNEDHYRNWLQTITPEQSDEVVIVKAIVDRFIPRGLYTQSDYDIAVNVFKAPVSDYYFDNDLYSIFFQETNYQIVLLLQHLFKQPEFQLN